MRLKIELIEGDEENEKKEKIQFIDEKTELRCINCGKKLKKRIYSNGNIRYYCKRCGL